MVPSNFFFFYKNFNIFFHFKESLISRSCPRLFQTQLANIDKTSNKEITFTIERSIHVFLLFARRAAYQKRLVID